MTRMTKPTLDALGAKLGPPYALVPPKGCKVFLEERMPSFFSKS